LTLAEEPSRGKMKTRGRMRGECEEDRENARTRQEKLESETRKHEGNEVEDEGRPSFLFFGCS